MQYSNCYDPYFQSFTAISFGGKIDWRWIKAQAIAESGLNPEAVSPAGARGVMQLMPGTSAEMARKLNISDAAFMPHLNIQMGIAYDRQCWNVWKKETGIERIRFMLGSYNAGVGNIVKAQKLAEESRLPTDRWEFIAMALPEITGSKNSAETINYVRKIETVYAYLTAEKSK